MVDDEMRAIYKKHLIEDLEESDECVRDLLKLEDQTRQYNKLVKMEHKILHLIEKTKQLVI